MQSLTKQVELPVTAEEAFDWHERSGALDRLIPPWESVEVLERGLGIREGSVVKLAQRIGPLRLKWIARHHGYRYGKCFHDTQIQGPFARWEHLHAFSSSGETAATLTDQIEYEIPGGLLGRVFGGNLIRRKLDAMFDYRHHTTTDDLTAHKRYQATGKLHVAVTGASGLVGSTLVPLLTTGGHRVTKLVRREAREGELSWNPQDDFDAAPLDGLHAVIHLAGENIAASRWTTKVKDKIRASRVVATRKVCEGLARMQSPPQCLVCASAIGIYGDRGDEVLTEASEVGQGFLSEVGQQWEAATQPARDAGIRVVNLRFGVILSPRGGALAKMLLPFRFGAGGRVGSGKQYWSWISIDDAAGAIYHALMTNSLAGPVNVVAPQPVTNLEFTKTLGRILNRPTIAPLPAFAARLALGEMANDLLLASCRVLPHQLIASDYQFRQPTLEAALRHILGRPATV